ncbi:MAG: sensor histidine kinase [Paenibacillaceae bacterium]|jgi:signal transduction histidine kinase|nr:sensor histidine kinase [Paenibacillaceae bacterium]
MSIRLRLTLWYTTILAVTLLGFGVSLYYASSYILMDSKKDEMRRMGAEIESQIVPVAFEVRGLPLYIPILPALDQIKYPGYFLQSLDLDGQVTKSTINQLLPLQYNKATVMAGKSQYSIQHIWGLNAQLLVLNKPLYVSVGNESKLIGVLQIAVNINSIMNNLHTLKMVLLFLFTVTIVVAASLGWYLAHKALKPIENVIIAAAQIEKGADLGVRIDYEGPEDEVGRLTNTINKMLARIQGAYTELEESDRAQRRFVSDASHELRTPLTTIRGNVELLEKMWSQMERASTSLEDPAKMEMSLEAMRDIAGEASRMSRLVNDLLSLARADAGYQMEKAPVLIREVAEEVARKAQHLPHTAEWQAGDFSVLQGIGVRGSKDYLQQMLFIFIENAFKYTTEGSVRFDVLLTEEQVGMKISDTGIGMEKEEVPHVFERFYRADQSRGVTSGTGLGLSIAKWIIDEHGGSVEVTTRAGSGTTFLVWLPVYFRQMEQ